MQQSYNNMKIHNLFPLTILNDTIEVSEKERQKLIDLVLNLFNPVVFIKDILNGVFKGITLIIEAAIDIAFNTPREKGDKVDIALGDWVNKLYLKALPEKSKQNSQVA